MAGNSARRNRRNPGSKKGASVGTGGHSRKALQGKGPTPPASARKGHIKQRQANAAVKREMDAKSRAGMRRSGGGGRGGRGGAGAAELVVGRNSVVEALQGGVPATALYVMQFIDTDDRVREAFQAANERGIPLMEAPRPQLDQMTGGLNHQGLVLQVPPYEYAHPEDLLGVAADLGEDALIMALDGVTDSRNLGAVVRSAAAFGAHGVVIPERRAAGMTAGAWKTSSGAAARLQVARATNLTRALEAYQKAGCLVVGLAADGEAEVGELEALTGPVVIVAGSEGKGLSRLVSETCDIRVRIPMPGATESLNAGVAAGIVLYEAARLRSKTS
ncbi:MULTISPECIES: 23S rRNA (guanosine(2251)-2'-O)-methyltransferase RlmB [Streptomycetaceae]|uniref:23S rRNA (guanosine(2251)-2'-O)-methyltransferase RlmB n=1 Tax=Streptomycetaceae TaxID=2062 RepID=UPI00093F9DF0|nr:MULTISPECIES: 23S rRNA (guanosine(2251)-2'-O)-methyltransferase RlmB [Streptomycetaceae]MDQ0309104.1 23S rRNA (guanosine2251-2'-O)-methyltransferase [Kitasatospora herbaricolor]OKI24357.1 23S rRNA (guanosine(2251)-2'-O)-methyltransferase RlmB [Streptomyces sp. CB03911]GGV03085.1 23S rRNA (guanosine(2251)-2'-O)-methyltransferase RlmB [Kitasatospora herbaricolor]